MSKLREQTVDSRAVLSSYKSHYLVYLFLNTTLLENINLCLNVLRSQHVAGVEGVSAQELRDGKLKAILALFFALSRHKQAAKARTQQQQQVGDMTPNRSSAIPHKGGSSIPLPGSAIPARRCPPDKVRPVASSSRSSSPALSMIPRAPPAQITSPYQSNGQTQKNSMLDKLKLFKNNDKPAPVSNGKRTSSSSGVSSARSERSDSSASLEPNVDLKPVRNTSRLKQTRPGKPAQTKNSPNTTKKEVVTNKTNKTAVEVEKHAHKVAQLPATKLTEPKIRVTINKDVKSHALPIQPSPGTGIPKPTAAIKGTSKITRDTSLNSIKAPSSTGVSRESSQVSLKQHKPAIALVSPIKNEKETNQLSESSHSASTGHQSNSSEGSVIYKPSSESGSEHHNVIPNRKEPLTYITDVTEQSPPPPAPQTPKEHVKHLDKPQNNPSAEKETKNISYQNISSKDKLDLTKDKKILNHISENPNEDREDNTLCIEPMRPLLRGYCSTLTLPSRQRHYQRVQPDGGSDYCEISLANGYLSDGEILRHTVVMDIGDGYMSEGGSALYTRRLQTMPAHIPNGPPGGAGRATPPPPPPAPRAASKSSRNGIPLQQDPKHHGGGQQWKRYTDSPGVGSPPPPPPAPAPSSPPAGRRERRGSPHGGGKDKASKGVRGVPQSFGYVKRNGNGMNGTTNGNGNGQPVQVIQNPSGKTAAVSAVPRTKVKVSGGTQTCSSDLQQPHKASPPQFKSYSLTGNAANQLSQSVRERLMMGSQSLPKGACHQDYGLVMRQVRPKASDGSLSDTQAIENTSPYAPWLRHSNTYSVAPRLSETDSMESLTSLPGHRSSLTHTRLLRDSPSRLSRSNSIRSTKSEKLYPSMLHRNTEPETEPYYCLPIGSLSHWSQPTSPAPGSARTFPLSPTHSSTPRHSIPKNDDVHGSSISLVSTASSLYSSAEEKQAHEIRKLRRELGEAQEKVHTLTSQLSTNFPFLTLADLMPYPDSGRGKVTHFSSVLPLWSARPQLGLSFEEMIKKPVVAHNCALTLAHRAGFSAYSDIFENYTIGIVSGEANDPRHFPQGVKRLGKKLEAEIYRLKNTREFKALCYLLFSLI
ncbi:hypothetical protein NQ315_011482 [Exocentrus adspersus]|uniref:Calponin-homology (CH) domain-containing protein n=1 Tax=Exocentrus adspersus TaxID=1586481 RepID=A0AAV8VWJ4_9CUCU|nr:hypothetical protein NQ315_011482 [Exocentrus adspersus]